MEKELPKNWVETELGNYVILKNGYAFKSTDFQNEGIPVIRISNIQDGKIDLNYSICVNDTKAKKDFIINRGDILIAMSGATTGKFGVYNLDEISLQNQRVGNLKPVVEKLSNKMFIYYLLGSLKEEIEQRAYGGAQPNISPKLIESIVINLPPLAEQNRIVAKLDSLFAQLESIKTSMAKIPVLLKNFRQQVLKQAVTGKLTDCVLENKRLGDLLIDVKYGTSKKSEYEIDGTPIFRIPNINDGEIDDKDIKYSILDDKEYQQLKLLKNDILIIRSNGSVNLVGRSAIIREQHIGYSYAGYLIRLRCSDKLNSKFLNFSLKSEFLRKQIVSNSHSSSGVNNINSQEIKDLTIYWTSIEEQQEIVSRVESLFAKADAIEEKYKNLKAKIETLPQTILHKAFKGELSEQLESDGDARVLLEEIVALKMKKK